MNDAALDIPAIELKGIRKTFILSEGRDAKKVLALDGVDLTIRQGEFLTIIGPSGCGKTTLLRIIASLINQDATLKSPSGGSFPESGAELVS